MNDIEWKEIHNFTKEENWGDSEKLSLNLMTRLDGFRGFIQKPIFITCGTQGQHVADSNHYLGFAVDCIIPDYHFLDGFINATRFGFTGIGVYPEWEYGGKRCGGFHFEWNPKLVGFPTKLWMGLGHCAVEQYVGITYENLKLHGYL